LLGTRDAKSRDTFNYYTRSWTTRIAGTGRTYIPKKNNKLRPLSLPTWSDKLLQEAIRLILEAYYEPQFSSCSHGFRPKRGCHTALQWVTKKGKGTKWFIEGDICSCFEKIDHSILLEIISEKIQDNRFIRLLGGLLKAGYLEKWKFNATYSGVPAGSLWEASHNDPYRKKRIMRRNVLRAA